MKKRRFLAWFAATLMLLTSFALPGSLVVREAEAASAAVADKYLDTVGWCGPKLYWEFYAYSGELVITGSGAMYDYKPSGEYVNPWVENGFADQITTVSFPRGITSIGAYGFYGCTALTSIALPSKVKTIGEGALEGCTGLEAINLPKSVTRIDADAFLGCAALQLVQYQGKMDHRVRIAIRPGNGCLLNAAWTYTKATAANLAIKTQPKNTKANEGKYATFKVKVSGATMIQWEYQPAGEETWYETGVTADAYSVLASTLLDGYQYRCKVTNGASVLISSPARLTVNPVKLTVKSHPKSVKTDEYKLVTFKAKAVGATHLMWQVKNAGDADWSDFAEDTESISFTAYSEYDGMLIRFAVSNDRGDIAYSREAKLTFKIKITQQPKAVTVYEGEYAEFTVDGAGYTDVQWEYMLPGINYWFEVQNGTQETCRVHTVLDDSGIVFRCRLYNSTTEKYSSKVKLTVKQAGLSGSRRAVLVGENDYTTASRLYGCVNDMNAMAGMLRGLDNSFATRTLPNSSKAQIMDAITNCFAGTTDESVSLFFYSGHGTSVKETNPQYDQYIGALVAIDGGYITFAELANALSKVNGRVIVILDSCFSGAAINKAGGDEATDKMIEAYNRSAIDAFSGYYMKAPKSSKLGDLATSKFVVITASKKTETSHDYYYDGSGCRQGQFTAAFVQGMGCTYPNGAYSGSTPADVNNDKRITLNEIYTYAYAVAADWADTQHAQYYGPADEVLFLRQ